jgi:RNA-binding protein NOB1
VYSVPKPIAGSANGKWKGGGGKGGWGTELVLAEDQKEFVRANAEEERRQRRERDLMDEDYLPGILTGERNKTGGRTKVGAGRNVNSKKR